MSSANRSAKLTYEVGANLEDAVAKLKQLTQELATAGRSSTCSDADKWELDAERAELKAYRLELEADRLEWEATRGCGGRGSSSDNKASDRELEAAKAELEAERVQLEAERTQLRLAQIKLKAAQSQLEEAKSKLEAAQSQLEEARRQLETARCHLEAAKSRTDINNIRLEAAKASLDAAKIRFESATEQLKEAKRKFEDAKTQLEAAAEDTSNITMICGKTGEQILEEENSELRDQVSQLQSEISKLRKRICQLESNSDTKRDVEMLERENAKLKEENRQLKTENAKLKDELKAGNKGGKKPEGKKEEYTPQQDDDIDNELIICIRKAKPVRNPTVFLEITYGRRQTEGKGRIVINLFADTTPLVAENFRALCTAERDCSRNGTRLRYYDSSINFVSRSGIAGGSLYCPVGYEEGKAPKTSIYGGAIPVENYTRKHTGPGDVTLVADHRKWRGCTFLIHATNNSKMDGREVVFGKVVQGMELVYEIMRAFPNTEGIKLSDDFVKITACGQVS